MYSPSYAIIEMADVWNHWNGHLHTAIKLSEFIYHGWFEGVNKKKKIFVTIEWNEVIEDLSANEKRNENKYANLITLLMNWCTKCNYKYKCLKTVNIYRRKFDCDKINEHRTFYWCVW